jgi:hypothetical protein
MHTRQIKSVYIHLPHLQRMVDRLNNHHKSLPGVAKDLMMMIHIYMHVNIHLCIYTYIYIYINVNI